MIIVAGIARSGLTATMQMLHAGGFPCAGEYPSFEKWPIGEIPWIECKGRAVKLVDAQLQIPPPGDYRIIRLSRDLKEQAKSLNKFAKYLMGFPPVSTKRLIESYKSDYHAIDMWASGYDTLNLTFEQIIKLPHRTAQKIARWLHEPVDAEKMAGCIIKRNPKCSPRLFEAEMVAS